MHIIALERVHEGLRDAIALRALHGREARFQFELTGEDAGFPSRVGRAVVAEHFDRVRRLVSTEALFDRLTLLAPDIQEAILEGRQAKGLQLEELTSPVPSGWGTNKYVYLVLIQIKMPGTATTALGDGETLGVRVGNVVLLVKPRTAFTEPSPAKSCSSERSSSHDDGRNV